MAALSRLRRIVAFLTVGWLAAPGCAVADPARPNIPEAPALCLGPTLHPSALHDAASGPVTIRGRVTDPDAADVHIRITTGTGTQVRKTVRVSDGAFQCAYPHDFTGANPLRPGILFVDATAGRRFDPSRSCSFQAEATVIVYDSALGTVPALPSPFTNDLLDRNGRTDQQSFEWPAMRTLVNLFMRSRAAHLIGLGDREFDLATPQDLEFFKRNLSLYEFDFRDRDWDTPLRNRRARTFWQAVWDNWFNPSNNHPLDGDDTNHARENFLAYTFANDFADTLINYLMLPEDASGMDDNLDRMRREGIANLLAMQHRDNRNFARRDARGREHVYTAGAFRYGLFENGEFLTEGKGWFYNPAHSDYVAGGVFNGRATWALGKALRVYAGDPLAEPLREAIAASLAFCLRDARAHGYARLTGGGNVYWRDPGEHAYLVLGMAAACAAAPDLPVPDPHGGPGPIPLSALTAAALDALVDLELPHAQWSVYPNVDSVAIAALADGASVLAAHPHAERWLRSARRVADAWLEARVDPAEFRGPVVHFGPRIAPDRMTFNWRHLTPDWPDAPRIHFYITGHWIHALARLHAVTGETRYRERFEAMIRYLCGDNPWQVRLLNELGAVPNWVDDLSGDGREDHLKHDFYPESTSFTLIGIMHALEHLAGRGQP